MLQIFCRCTCWFRIFGSGLISVEDIDAPDRSSGAVMPCGRLGLCREPVDRAYDVV